MEIDIISDFSHKMMLKKIDSYKLESEAFKNGLLKGLKNEISNITVLGHTRIDVGIPVELNDFIRFNKKYVIRMIEDEIGTEFITMLHMTHERYPPNYTLTVLLNGVLDMKIKKGKSEFFNEIATIARNARELNDRETSEQFEEKVLRDINEKIRETAADGKFILELTIHDKASEYLINNKKIASKKITDTIGRGFDITLFPNFHTFASPEDAIKNGHDGLTSKIIIRWEDVDV